MKNKWINNIKEITHKYDYFLFDCDGVIWNHHDVFPHTAQALRYLHQEGKKLFFISNINRKPRKEIHEKLTKSFGNFFDERCCYTSSYLTGKFIKSNYPWVEKIYLVGRRGLQTELENFGFKIYGGEKDDDKRLSLDEARDLVIDKEIQAVVCGSDDKINFYKLSYAANVIDQTKLFFGTNIDHCAQFNEKLRVPGAYTYITAIETASDHNAIIISKPNPYAMKIIMDEFSIDYTMKDKSVFIGDTLSIDIRFANHCQIDSVLVFSGNTEKESYLKMIKEKEESSYYSPTYLLEYLM